MLFEHRYFEQTRVSSTSGSTAMSFAPDLRRDPTFLTGRLRRKLPFREAMSALHAVVTSDLRFRPRDRSEYRAWRAKQDEVDLAELAAARSANRATVAALNAELAELRRRHLERGSPFLKAKRRFFEWLFTRHRDAWMVLDPVVTVHPDEVAFECFSRDESAYGRLACGHEVFEQVGGMAFGTTNVDYSQTLYEEFQKIREDKETTLAVDPSGFEVRTGADEAYREVKIDLPDSWVRGFLQVGTAMTLPGPVTLDLHPMDVHNLCFVLRRHKEVVGPRSLRFLLEPGRPARALVEPFGITLDFPRSRHDATLAAEIRVWGRRRLLVLERLIPVATGVRVALLGTGMPSFWTAALPDMSFTLGLSGWTANDWAASANFDLLAPRGEVDAGTIGRVVDALRRRWLATPAELSAELGLDGGTVGAALVALAQAGRAMADLSKGVWRLRELTREPLDLAALRFANEREAQALTLLAAGASASARLDDRGHTSIVGEAGGRAASVRLDADRRLVAGECDCAFFFRNKLRKGPCEHMLALRLAHERRLAGPASPSSAARPEPVPVAAPGAPRGDEPSRFVRWLEERELVELADARAFHDVVADVLRLAGPRARASRLWRALGSHPSVGEFYVLSEEDLVALFEEWG